VRGDIRKYLKSRVYLALVEGVPRERAGTIRSHLKDDEDLVVRRAPEGEGKLAVTHYRVVAVRARQALLEIRLETGRKNQIRAHLAGIGHPVAGDRKYGARTDPAGRVALHAARLDIRHPVTGLKLKFESPLPPELARAAGERRS
jgi:23S rRNA pseudouridine1911/1915/1917 synthase